ncbi:hypothetical protein NMG60_11011783 [Bertholletia excelsa]
MVSALTPPCPLHSFLYNASLCACDAGYWYNATAKGCELFNVSQTEWILESGVDYSVNFPETVFSFDYIKKFTQSQAVFLEATFVLLLSWLAFCFFVRFGGLGDGRTIWFRIRWWISRLDICFATRHWLDDQKVVTKRKTELGGAFSIASWILFIGLFAALLFQTISNRTVEVHNVKATNAPELASFVNDMEFNITTVSSMSCSHLHDLGTLYIGTPGFVEHRTTSLSTFVNYTCKNSSRGPTITLKCDKCQLIPDSAYISWQFVDLPNDPATAVGFQFNLSAKNHARKKHLSFVSGTLRNGSNDEDKPITFRGPLTNVLKFNLFPRIYRNLHDLKLIQPLFHEFLPGSHYGETSQLQASLQRPNDGLVNVTLYVNFLSSYIVEIDNESTMGPVSFLADLGGLLCISIGIFFYFLVQCEYRIKKLRDEDCALRKIRNRRKAQDRWDKLRKYVMYTWGCKTLDDKYGSMKEETCCTCLMIEPLHQNGSLHKRRQTNRMSLKSLSKDVKLAGEKKASGQCVQFQQAQSYLPKSASSREVKLSSSSSELVLERRVAGAVKNRNIENSITCKGDVLEPQDFHTDNDSCFPLPPSSEFKAGSEFSISDIQKNLQSLYEYNVLITHRLAAAQSMLQELTKKASSSGSGS